VVQVFKAFKVFKVVKVQMDSRAFKALQDQQVVLVVQVFKDSRALKVQVFKAQLEQASVVLMVGLY
jgi:hypothetical protein